MLWEEQVQVSLMLSLQRVTFPLCKATVNMKVQINFILTLQLYLLAIEEDESDK